MNMQNKNMKTSDIPASLPAEDISKLNMDCNQLLLVSVKTDASTEANVSFYIKNKNTWALDFSTLGHIGKNGLGKTKEGDSKTPLGTFDITAAFGIAPKPEHASIPYQKTDSTHWVVSDPGSPYYNQFVSAVTHKSEEDTSSPIKKVIKNWNSSFGEQLYEYKTAYKYSLILNYNPENIPGKGSAIFLHCYSKNPYTAGCVAIPEERMEYLISKLELDEKNHISAKIIINTAENLKNRIVKWA
jgi:Uncharacterized protein conserved in bacteria